MQKFRTCPDKSITSFPVVFQFLPYAQAIEIKDIGHWQVSCAIAPESAVHAGFSQIPLGFLFGCQNAFGSLQRLRDFFR